MSRKQVWKVVGLTLLVCGSLYAQKITPFDAQVPPGTGPTQGTYPTAITPAGIIVGIVLDAYGVYHGFVRSRDGTTNPFDPPGSTSTIVTGINGVGTITGYYTDANGVVHGFLRASNGQITTIDDPGAGANIGEGTFPLGISPAGEITGYYYDTNSASHGFLRTPGGTFKTFDPPTSLATIPEAINSKGEIMGVYLTFDPNITPPGAPGPGANLIHFFLRAKNGTFTSIDPPGLVSANQSGSAGYAGGLSPILTISDGSINPAGSVVGYFFDGSGQQGFLRTPNGTITPIEEPNSYPAPQQPPDYTFVNAINPLRTIIGQYLSSDGSTTHGFVRHPKGNYTTIDGPNSVLTDATAINPVGEITGWYQDANDRLFHGFVRTR